MRSPSRPPANSLFTQSQRQEETQIPNSAGHSPASQGGSLTGVAGPDRAAADTDVTVEELLATADAQQKCRRKSPHKNKSGVHRYVAQTAYTQRNPFRIQEFAVFATNPQYRPPPDIVCYPRTLATHVSRFEASRASQGDFMTQRLVDAAHPSTPEERDELEAFLGTTLEKLQIGDWFYKRTRSNCLHRRYVWLNLQRGTIMWSSSPKGCFVLKSEVKLSTVTRITPDCLQPDARTSVLYRMSISTPGRCICLATEIRHKFDLWYSALQQLTAPNLTHHVPGILARPSMMANVSRGGAASRWESRYSPLNAIIEGMPGAVGSNEFQASRVVSSSD
ncbi:hypothetical protein JKF63_04120 [Porcisia hertigi]|uniref:Pleckstrin homology domain-containing protein n=1 Tax=Porcisia hertigi TaxID=2761500 RepID=A0A836IRZ2_9TRYP|nr:hypothetical protein JKF63_04120 [Porcisia hertigi]